jgi:KEOPS complex subunit Cgi121
MLIQQESNFHVMEFQIIAGRVNIENVPDFIKQLNLISSGNGSIIQAMDARKIAGRKHVEFAVEKALHAKGSNTNIAKDLGVELMRYASGKRQIEGAFSMGVSTGDNDIVLVVLGSCDAVNRSVSELKDIVSEYPVIDYTASKRKDILAQFCITDAELEAVGEDMIPDIVLERVALVNILK